MRGDVGREDPESEQLQIQEDTSWTHHDESPLCFITTRPTIRPESGHSPFGGNAKSSAQGSKVGTGVMLGETQRDPCSIPAL